MKKRRVNQLDKNAENELAYQNLVTLTLDEAKTMFLKDIRGLAKQTQRWHRENLTALEKVLAKQDIVIIDCRDLTTPFLKDNFIFYMLDVMKLKTNTINGRIRSVRKLIQFLHREGYLKRDYGTDMPLLKGERVIIQTFSEEQIVHLLRQPIRHTFSGLRDYTIMLLLLETGIRISECITITLSDVDLKAGQILIHGKGAKQRLVPIQSKMRRALNEYLQIRGNAPTDALFITVDYQPISQRQVQELIHDYGETANIKGVRVSPHTFRHTMAKFYILAGGDIFSLQRILGHSSLETVRLYVKMFASDVQRQHNKFSFVENRLHN